MPDQATRHDFVQMRQTFRICMVRRTHKKDLENYMDMSSNT